MKLEDALRKIVQEETQKLLSEVDHSRNIEVEENITVRDMKTGDMLRVPFKGEYRLFFIVWPGDGEYFHALDLEKMTEREIASFFAHVYDRLSPMARRMMEKTFPRRLTLGPIKKDENFYHDIIKSLGFVKRNYRTPKISNIGDDVIQRVVYKPSLSGEISDYLR
jgi:hypothetical protein